MGDLKNYKRKQDSLGQFVKSEGLLRLQEANDQKVGYLFGNQNKMKPEAVNVN